MIFSGNPSTSMFALPHERHVNHELCPPRLEAGVSLLLPRIDYLQSPDPQAAAAPPPPGVVRLQRGVYSVACNQRVALSLWEPPPPPACSEASSRRGACRVYHVHGVTTGDGFPPDPQNLTTPQCREAGEDESKAARRPVVVLSFQCASPPPLSCPSRPCSPQEYLPECVASHGSIFSRRRIVLECVSVPGWSFRETRPLVSEGTERKISQMDQQSPLL